VLAVHAIAKTCSRIRTASRPRLACLASTSTMRARPGVVSSATALYRRDYLTARGQEGRLGRRWARASIGADTLEKVSGWTGQSSELAAWANGSRCGPVSDAWRLQRVGARRRPEGVTRSVYEVLAVRAAICFGLLNRWEKLVTGSVLGGVASDVDSRRGPTFPSLPVPTQAGHLQSGNGRRQRSSVLAPVTEPASPPRACNFRPVHFLPGHEFVLSLASESLCRVERL
jgi:hypothetical protein